MEQDGEKVSLYIYDLTQGMARPISTVFLGSTIEGIWHTGIGVFGKEYFFGAGIHSVPIGCSPFGTPLETLELGYTHVPKDVFEEFLRGVGSRYTMLTYNLLKHNCNNFTDEAAQFLVGSGIPHYILTQADTAFNNPLGAMLLPVLQQLETTLLFGRVPVVPDNTSGASSPFPNPSAPSRSSSGASAHRGSFGSFPAPSPPAAFTGVSPVVPPRRTEPTPPRGVGNKGGK